MELQITVLQIMVRPEPGTFSISAIVFDGFCAGRGEAKFLMESEERRRIAEQEALAQAFENFYAVYDETLEKE